MGISIRSVVKVLEQIVLERKLAVLIGVGDGQLMLKHVPSGITGHGANLAEAMDDFVVGLHDGGLLDGG